MEGVFPLKYRDAASGTVHPSSPSRFGVILKRKVVLSTFYHSTGPTVSFLVRVLSHNSEKFQIPGYIRALERPCATIMRGIGTVRCYHAEYGTGPIQKTFSNLQ